MLLKPLYNLTMTSNFEVSQWSLQTKTL